VRAAGRPYGNERVFVIETGSIMSHTMDKSLWKRLWICRKTD
jgi:hypothetical protein